MIGVYPALCPCYFLFVLDNILTVDDKSYDLKILFDLSNKKIDLSKLDQKIDAHLRSYQIAGINTENYNPEQLIPQFLYFCADRSEKLKILFEEVKDPDILAFYEKFRPFIKFLNKINNQELLTDLKPNKISFNATGSKDGRLSTKKGFLNIYSLVKEDRHKIKCEAGYRFVQCDYRSFQPRLAIFLTKDDVFKGRFVDVEDIYQGEDRAQNKLHFFRVMFGVETSSQPELRPIFDLRKSIFEEIKTKGKIINPFGRPIWYSGEDEHTVFRNFITSCESDFVFGVAVKLDTLLSGRRSRIKFLFHDAVMFEIHEEETFLLKQIKQIMEGGYNARYPVKTSVGKNWGEMKILQ